MPQLKLSYCQEDSIGKLKFHFTEYKRSTFYLFWEEALIPNKSYGFLLS